MKAGVLDVGRCRKCTRCLTSAPARFPSKKPIIDPSMGFPFMILEYHEFCGRCAVSEAIAYWAREKLGKFKFPNASEIIDAEDHQRVASDIPVPKMQEREEAD